MRLFVVGLGDDRCQRFALRCGGDWLRRETRGGFRRWYEAAQARGGKRGRRLSCMLVLGIIILRK